VFLLYQATDGLVLLLFLQKSVNVNFGLELEGRLRRFVSNSSIQVNLIIPEAHLPLLFNLFKLGVFPGLCLFLIEAPVVRLRVPLKEVSPKEGALDHLGEVIIFFVDGPIFPDEVVFEGLQLRVDELF